MRYWRTNCAMGNCAMGNCAMANCGGLLAGCPEALGQVMEINGKMYKQYRGMGGLAAMKPGSAARYGHDMKSKTDKITAEGVEALKEVSSSLDDSLRTFVGGIQSGMGYLGAGLRFAHGVARRVQVWRAEAK